MGSVRLTWQAQEELRSGEALVFDWHRVATCCACRALPHLHGRDVAIDCRRVLGLRRFVSDLPPEFGLRASLGRLPEEEIP